jgi:uncharacterized protein YbaA (DUF1428 family)
MVAYIDGFLVPVPEGSKDAYLTMSRDCWPVFKDLGALRQVETWGHDLPKGEVTDFFRAVQAKEGENVVFSWIIWPSKEARDAGWGRFMEDERIKAMSDMPFDGKRMFWGGLTPLFDSDGELAA